MLQNALATIQNILNAAIPVFVALGVVYFVWGVVTYVIAGGEEAKKTGRDRIIYGVIGLAVIVSLWGLVNIVVNTFGLGTAATPALPAGSSSACSMGTTFKGLVNYVTCIINSSVIPLIFALALASFVWGVVKFFLVDADEEAKRSQGKQFMIWGLITLTAMLCVWGLVSILGDTIGIDTNIIPQTRE